MPGSRAEPTLRRRRLGKTLRQLRVDAGLSAEQLAEAMNAEQTASQRSRQGRWEQSKVSRVELAKTAIRPDEVERWLRVVQKRDRDLADALMELARTAAQRGWWHMYGATALPRYYEDLLGLEDEATSEHSWTGSLVPGILQTSGYASESIARTAPWKTPDEVAATVRVRIARQAVLTRPQEPLRLRAVINEAAFYHRFNPAGIMRDQVRHILDLTELPHVDVQLMPVSAPQHQGMAGSFHLLRFHHPWPDVVHLENLTSGSLVEGTDEVDRYRAAIDDVIATAMPVTDSRAMLKKIADEEG